jgi:DNA-binding PadR family transcriptional regulator
VLGLVAGLGTATPYELKQMVNGSIGHFWSFPHSQLYSEPDRLTDLGLLEVEQEESGRHRKRYSATEAGREVLQAWLREPDTSRAEIREPGLLQLFFGALTNQADMTKIAEARVKLYEQDLERYAEIEKNIAGQPDMDYPYATLRLGIAFTRASLAFWSELAETEPPSELPAGLPGLLVRTGRTRATQRVTWPFPVRPGSHPPATHQSAPRLPQPRHPRSRSEQRLRCVFASLLLWNYY